MINEYAEWKYAEQSKNMRNRLKIWRIIKKRKKFYKSLSQEKN